MNRKNWFSAILAVMMVISMMACIALPAVAASDITLDEARQLPLASSVSASDTHTKYQINSVSELIAASIASVTSNPTANTTYAFLAGDTLYLTADLDISNWSGWERWATYDAGTGKYTTIGNHVANPNKTSYLVYSPTAPGVECANLAEVFAVLFNGFNARNAKYNIGYFNFDGMGHTIYNYYDHASFFAATLSGDATIKNLTFENALVDTAKEDTTLWTNRSAAILLRSTDNGGGANIDNVHIKNSTLIANAGTSGMFVSVVNNNSPDHTRNCDISNCTLTGSTLECTKEEEVYGIGLIAGVLDQRGSVKNCLLQDNTIKLKSDVTSLSFAITSQYKKNSFGNMMVDTIDNVALINNKVLTQKTTDPGMAVLLDTVQGTKGPIAIDNIYAMGNTWATTDANWNVTGTVNPVENLINDPENKLGNTATGLTLGNNIKVDAGVTKILNIPNESMGLGRANVAPTAVNKVTNMTPDLIKTVYGGADYAQFVMDNNSVLFAADADGKVAVDGAALSGVSGWTVDGQAVVPDLNNLVINQSTVYTASTHSFTMVPVAGSHQHQVTCNTCTDAAHNYTVSCEEFAVEGNPVPGDYYVNPHIPYTCVCGNSWIAEDTTAPAPETPITVAFDSPHYTGNDAAVKVSLGAKADANLLAYTATVTFDAGKLEYVDYSTAFNCVVDDSNKANGVLVVAFAQAGGLVLNTEAMTLNFTTKNIASDGSMDLQVAVGTVVVSTANGALRKTPLTPNTGISADLYYVPDGAAPIFTAGDVNKDTKVNLLDAVLVIQEINGTMHANQQAVFEPWAADVDGDRYISSNDVTILLQNSVGIAVTLIPATQRPIVIV